MGGRLKAIYLIGLCLAAVVLAGCVPASYQETPIVLQETAEPTAEPTSTSAPTEEPTPTATPVAELPLIGFERIFPLIQEVEPEAYLEISDCVNLEDTQCVTTVDFCPEAKECPHVLMIFNMKKEHLFFANRGDFESEEAALERYREYIDADPIRRFDDQFDFELFKNFDLGGLGDDVVLSLEAEQFFACMWENFGPFVKAAYPITEEILVKLRGTGQRILTPEGVYDNTHNIYWLPGLFVYDMEGFELREDCELPSQ